MIAPTRVGASRVIRLYPDIADSVSAQMYIALCLVDTF